MSDDAGEVEDYDEVGEIKGIETAKTASEGMPLSKTLPRGYLSVSQVTQYIRCGEAYFRRYVTETPIPSTTFQVTGRAVHKSAEVLHNSIIGGAPISVEQMVSVYSDVHDAEIEGAVSTGDEPDVGKLKDTGVGLAKKYHHVALNETIDDVTKKVLSPIQPISAERVVRTVLNIEGAQIPFMAVIDVEEQDAVIDLKTKSKMMAQSEADNSFQLAIYSAITRKPVTRLDVLSKPTKTMGVRYTRLESIKMGSEIKHALSIVADVAEDVAAGRFRKAPMDSFQCSSRWCPYWGDCRGKKL